MDPSFLPRGVPSLDLPVLVSDIPVVNHLRVLAMLRGAEPSIGVVLRVSEPIADELEAWDIEAIVGDMYRGRLQKLEPAGELRPDTELWPDTEEVEFDAVAIERERIVAESLVVFLSWSLKSMGFSITLVSCTIATGMAGGAATGPLSTC